MSPEIGETTTKNIGIIKSRLKTVQDKQKSYTDLKQSDIEYEVGDKVFLKISSWNHVMRFRKREKLNPIFIDPYEIVVKVGPVTYRLALSP